MVNIPEQIGLWRKEKKKVLERTQDLQHYLQILICLLINTAWHSQMFGSKLKGMGDILKGEITVLPCPGKIGQNLRLSPFSGTQEKARGEKAGYSWSKKTFFFAVVWIKWMNIFRPAYFTPRHLGGVISLSGQRAEWKESIR